MYLPIFVSAQVLGRTGLVHVALVGKHKAVPIGNTIGNPIGNTRGNTIGNTIGNSISFIDTFSIRVFAP